MQDRAFWRNFYSVFLSKFGGRSEPQLNQSEGGSLAAPQPFSLFTHSHCYPSLYKMRSVCVSEGVSKQACAHSCVCACVHVWAIWFFFFSLCVRVKRTWRHVPFLSCPSPVQPRQGLSRVRRKGGRIGGKKAAPPCYPPAPQPPHTHSWFGHCRGEEHYSHWCSGRMAKTPRSFRKGSLFTAWCDPQDWVGRWVLSSLWAQWEHCPGCAALAPLAGSPSWKELPGCLYLSRFIFTRWVLGQQEVARQTFWETTEEQEEE